MSRASEPDRPRIDFVRAMTSAEIRRRVSLLRQLLRSGRFEKAAGEAEEAIAQYPDSVELLAVSADIHRREKKLDEAKALLERARAIEPMHPAVLASSADLAYDRGRFEDAASLYLELVDRRPSSYHYSRLVAAKNRLGAHEEAVAIARRALERFPGDPWTLRGLATAESKLGRQEEAVAVYEELLSVAPDDRFAYKELMRLKTDESSPEEAASALKGLMRSGSRGRNPTSRRWPPTGCARRGSSKTRSPSTRTLSLSSPEVPTSWPSSASPKRSSVASRTRSKASLKRSWQSLPTPTFARASSLS